MPEAIKSREADKNFIDRFVSVCRIVRAKIFTYFTVRASRARDVVD